MEIDFSAFDKVYNAFITNIVDKLNKQFSYKISILNKEYHLGDIVVLYINGKEFKFNLMKYIDKCIKFGEKKAFNNLQKNIQKLENTDAKKQ